MRPVLATLTAVLSVAAAAPTTASAAPAPDTELARIAAECEAVTAVFDDGNSIVFDDPASIVQPFCVMELALPRWLQTMIGNTTSLSGILRNEVGRYTVLNSYHPDNGMFLAIYDHEAMEDWTPVLDADG